VEGKPRVSSRAYRSIPVTRAEARERGRSTLRLTHLPAKPWTEALDLEDRLPSVQSPRALKPRSESRRSSRRRRKSRSIERPESLSPDLDPLAEGRFRCSRQPSSKNANPSTSNEFSESPRSPRPASPLCSEDPAPSSFRRSERAPRRPPRGESCHSPPSPSSASRA